ncbi:nucleolar protein 14 [Lasiosphaeris hirsuta]|uniref:Nucleolar protein 14 n=1 Tax=Lasiosphaeris hirsuta TaxID=260670 RepID=A0AA40BC94_9PEZI|nr:nucleolar protein 14 [Lasiosphaeris hirsuta]
MPGSQLKRLKASLKDQGIIGPQKSKKERRKNAQDQNGKGDKRLQRSEALEGIREQFNPFQFKTNARGPKFEVTTNKPANDKTSKGISGRPGVAKSIGEERRRQTLLVEMQRRNKVGGIIDRRFGENDPNMTLEDKMIERFTREQQRSHKRGGMFDLEDDVEEMAELTHAGKIIAFDEEMAMKDDFDGEDMSSDGESDSSHAARRKLKRFRADQADAGDAVGEEDDGQPDKKKTKQEIYSEIMAKSKLHKYERQAAKEEDGELRAELDKELPELQALLFQRGKPQSKEVKGAVIAGVDKAALDKDYDIRVKQLAAGKRAQPAERTKTEEEVVKEESERLKELEEKRQKRMRGGYDGSDDEEVGEDEGKPSNKIAVRAGRGFNPADAVDEDDEDEFGLGKGIKVRPTATELGFDDEDDFLIDDDLVASGAELELDSDDMDSEGGDEDGSDIEPNSDDDEFTKGILTEAEAKNPPIFKASSGKQGDDEDGIPYTFPCPQTHVEMLAAFEGLDITELPVAVQRIRALYHPKLDSGNKERLGNFAQALVRHVAYLGDNFEPHWFPALESLLRHIHSLAKSFPIEVSKGYRAIIQEMEQDRPLGLTVGDLVLLTGIGTTFPTSDHFHQVVTPAVLSIARFLGQKIPQNVADYATGTYLSILAIQYQQFSMRYVPELMNFCLNTLCALAHEKPREAFGLFPLHEPAAGIRIKRATQTPIRKLNCAECRSEHVTTLSAAEETSLKVAILSTTTSILKTAAETWSGAAAFYETFTPAVRVLDHLTSKANSAHLPPTLVVQIRSASAFIKELLEQARLARRPLELHHHKPLAIRTFVPKFEDSFDPTKHYDPDRERAEMAKLKAEHKRERKGAMRELRKDAHFMARENLRVKKERDTAYEKKYKRLVSEIQGQEGQAANEYEREKAKRQQKKDRAKAQR